MRPLLSALAVSAALLALPAAAQPPSDSVACLTIGDLYSYLNFREIGDRGEAERLLQTSCRGLAGASFEVIDEKNGVARIRVFREPNKIATAVSMFTLDEMARAP